MTPLEFKTAWAEYDEQLRPISLSTLDKLNLSQSTIDFLHLSGLPDYPAPFLSFVGDINVKDKYDCIDLLTNWFDFLPPEFSKYVAIGSDGCGDIIALNTHEGCIVEWLDHEDNFSSRFMNTSIIQLASSLIAYHQFIKAIKKENGDDAYIDGNFSDTQFKILKNILQSIDPRSVTEGFWQIDLDSLLAQREGST